MDVYEIITERIIEKLNEGVIPWRKPWTNYASGLPRNGVSKREYTGLNLFLARLNDYASPDFFTARQIKELGGSIKKGEKGNIITFWRLMEYKDATGEEKTVPLLRYYQVWNRTQCTGLPAPKADAMPANVLSPVEAAEALINGYADCPQIREGEARAYYTPTSDFVNMPIRGSFGSPADNPGKRRHKMTYQEMKNRHQEEFNALPLMAAFDMRQFEEGKRRLGVINDDELLNYGYGCFIRKVDMPRFNEHSERTAAERKAAMQDFSFCVGMFEYEMANHEYGYTRNISDTLGACGLTADEINADKMLQKALNTAIKNYLGKDK